MDFNEEYFCSYEDLEVIHSRVEDVVLPNNIKVDAIVSEWMGFFLLHEGMLDSVLFARHKFLKENGEMFPESATVYVAPCSSLYDKWNDVYGVSMSTFAKELRTSKSQKPEIQTISANEVMGEEIAMAWINLKEDMPEDLNSFTIQHVVELSTELGREVLSTAPSSPETHWKQTIIVLPEELEVEASEPIAFQLDMNRDPLNGRRYNLEFTMLDPADIEHPLPCSCDMTKCILIKKFMKQTEQQALESKASGTPMLVEESIDDDDDKENARKFNQRISKMLIKSFFWTIGLRDLELLLLHLHLLEIIAWMFRAYNYIP
ncbi:hypothetical protein MSG28_008662 [Choristoneura fumiferana]|uniref:Uncharacterized protein n=1 Tax=Choristoneura fumiferana TaxID=7141 RepID=A0ACC0J7M2_CHOFU|nr:hypothetical protein MSG28_008662 [Choristoneura fumiferana]